MVDNWNRGRTSPNCITYYKFEVLAMPPLQPVNPLAKMDLRRLSRLSKTLSHLFGTVVNARISWKSTQIK